MIRRRRTVALVLAAVLIVFGGCAKRPSVSVASAPAPAAPAAPAPPAEQPRARRASRARGLEFSRGPGCGGETRCDRFVRRRATTVRRRDRGVLGTQSARHVPHEAGVAEGSRCEARREFFRTRGLVACAALLAGAIIVLVVGPVYAQQRKPNILVIFGDDIGVSNVSAYSLGLVRPASIGSAGRA